MRAHALWLCLLSAGCSSFVENHPRTLFLGETYQPEAVRDAIARAMNRRRMALEGESGANAFAVSTRSGAACAYVVSYSDHSLVINAGADGVNPAPSPTMIDARCLNEADVLGKAIQKEVQRPGKVAAKEERRRERHELAVARANAAAAQADAVSQEAQLQQQQLAQQPQPDGTDAQQPDAQQPVEQAAPVEEPRVVNRVHNTRIVNSTSTSNTSINYNVVNAAPPPEAQAPPLNPLLCCRARQPYVCPSVPVYAAACVKNPAELPSQCRLDPSQARYCP
jgi:hypothetical protein